MKNCAQDYNSDELENAIDYCIMRDLYSANDFRDTLIFFRADEPKIAPKPVTLPARYQTVQAQTRSLDRYVYPCEAGAAQPQATRPVRGAHERAQVQKGGWPDDSHPARSCNRGEAI